MSDFSLRLMTEADVSGANELRKLVGWNQTEQDWRRLLALAPEGCFVAERDGEIIGSVTTTAYGETLAWIGMMLVHPDHRRQGMGRCLMTRAIEYLQNFKLSFIKLDATPAGFPLYSQLGFITEWTLTRWHRAAGHQLGPQNLPDQTTRPVSPSDWPDIESLDAAAFGLPRGRLLRALAEGSRQVRVRPAQGRISGWAMLRPGSIADYLGPIECPSTEAALSLVCPLLAAIPRTPVFWDIPDLNASAREVAKSLGFEPVRPLTRMSLSKISQGSPSAMLFAIADPAVG